MKVLTDDKRILKHIIIDILNLKHGMEDNLLLIQQINLMIQKEGEEQKRFDDVIHAAQQHIDSINTVYTLGVSWLKDDTEFAVRLTKGKMLISARKDITRLQGCFVLAPILAYLICHFFVVLQKRQICADYSAEIGGFSVSISTFFFEQNCDDLIVRTFLGVI